MLIAVIKSLDPKRSKNRAQVESFPLNTYMFFNRTKTLEIYWTKGEVSMLKDAEIISKSTLWLNDSIKITSTFKHTMEKSGQLLRGPKYHFCGNISYAITWSKDIRCKNVRKKTETEKSLFLLQCELCSLKKNHNKDTKVTP